MTQIDESPALFTGGGPWDRETRIVVNDGLNVVVEPTGSGLHAKYVLARDRDSVGFRMFEYVGVAKSLEAAQALTKKKNNKAKRK